MRGSRIVVGLTLVAAVLAAVPPAAAAVTAPASADASARADVAALPRATTVNDADGNKLFDDLDTAFAVAGPAERLDVIVSFVADVATAEGVAAVRRVAPAAPVDRSFTIIPAYAGALTAAEAAAVADLAQVRQIELDSVGEVELETATAVMGADAVVDGLGISGSLDGLPDEVTAGDVTIAILDTGFDVGHVDVDGKLEAFVDLADGLEEPYDSDGHGTHVTSIAAGWGRGDPAQRGVAPGAGIVGLRIENESHALAGYEWIVANREAYDIRVATISFGFGIASDGTTALERAVDAAWDAGVVCFKSNGNSGPASSTMTVPAAARGILAMGSLLDTGGVTGATATVGSVRVNETQKYGFLLSEYSSRGPTSDGRVKPDLVAPGEAILAADAGTADGYISFSGTSMAAPFGAGTAALMVAANPALTPDQVREILTATAEDFGKDGADSDFGHGRVQVLDAVEAALRARGVEPPAVTRPAVPKHTWATGASVTFTVTDTTVPVAITAIAAGKIIVSAAGTYDGVLLGMYVTGPDGFVQHLPANADRQHHVSFMPSSPGTYTVNAGSAGDVTFAVSHG